MNQPQNSKPISVDLWFWDNAELAAAETSLTELLNDDELARRDRQFNRDKALYWSLSRARVRQLLSRVTGLAPRDLVFVGNSYGQLSLGNESLTSPSFSISHSGTYSVLAVCEVAPVGVDIEAVQRLTSEEMEWPLSPVERTDLAKVAPGDVPQAFFRYWTLKEAFIKALGLGVSFPLHDFDFNPFGEDPALLRVAGQPTAPADWIFEASELRPQLRFALAVKTNGARMTRIFHPKTVR